MSIDLRHNGEERDEELGYESSSSISDAESCSSDLEDETTSDQDQPSDCKKLDASGSLYDFSSLMAQLPNQNKKGLSKYYNGKSQSFTCLSDVKCIEDVPKKMIPYKSRIETCKSYADGLSDNTFCDQTPNNKDIVRKPSRGSCGNLLARNNGSILMCRPPQIPLNKHSSRLS